MLDESKSHRQRHIQSEYRSASRPTTANGKWFSFAFNSGIPLIPAARCIAYGTLIELLESGVTLLMPVFSAVGLECGSFATGKWFHFIHTASTLGRWHRSPPPLPSHRPSWQAPRCLMLSLSRVCSFLWCYRCR
jgi:hypothetical protein